MAGVGSRRVTVSDELWLDARDYLKLEMARQGVNAQELASRIGVKSQSIYNVTGETRRPISPGLARGLAEVLGGTVEFWLGNRFPNVALDSEGPESPQLPSRAGVLTDREIKRLNGAGDGDGFQIGPLEEGRVKGASIDLSIGLIVTKGFFEIPKQDRDLWFTLYQLHHAPTDFSADLQNWFAAFPAKHNIEFKDYYELKPGHSVHIVAAQMAKLGPRYFCNVGQMNECNLRGLQVLCGSQIDPGFSGPLVFLVKNVLSEGSIKLQRGDDLASLTLYALTHAVDQPYAENRLSRVRELIDKLRRAFFTFAEANPADTRLNRVAEALRGTSDRDQEGLSSLLDKSDRQLRSSVWAVLKTVMVGPEDIMALADFLRPSADGLGQDSEHLSDRAPIGLFAAIDALAGENPDQRLAYAESILEALTDLARHD